MREYSEHSELCISRRMVDLMSAWKKGMGPDSGSYQNRVKPGECWRPGHAKQRQASWHPRESVPPTANQTAVAGFRVWGGCHPPDAKRQTPSSGGKMFAARAKTHPRNPHTCVSRK